MNPKEYKDMMSHLVRPDTRPPEVQKAAEEKRFNADLDSCLLYTSDAADE